MKNRTVNRDNVGFFEANEVEANMFFAYLLLAISAAGLVSLFLSHKSDMDNGVNHLVLDALFVLASLFAGLYTIKTDGVSKFAKYGLLTAGLVVGFVLSVRTVYSYSFVIFMPVIIGVIYCDSAFTLKSGIAAYVTYLVSRLFSILFGLSSGYYDLGLTTVPDGTVLTVNDGLVNSLAAAGILNTDTVIMTEIAGIILHTVFFIILVAACILVAAKGKRLADDFAKSYNREAQAEREVEKARTKVFVSQLEPHFLYNSLSAIMAIDGNPPETIDALGNFAKYLRGNLNSLVTDELIPFNAELDHIERYTALEKLRFKDRLNINYEIETIDFLVPPLSVQMVVENAIKHGVSVKPEGGTVTIRTENIPNGVRISVEDDGVGFDTTQKPDDGRSHIGLENIKRRIELLSNGTVSIVSAPGVGTVVEITIGS